MALPARKYYPLKKAALELGCDIDDLLHYAAIGILQLCVHIDINRKDGVFAYISSDISDDSFDSIINDKEISLFTYQTNMNYIQEDAAYYFYARENNDEDGLITEARGWFGINASELTSPEFELTGIANVLSVTALREHFEHKDEQSFGNTEGYTPGTIFFPEERSFSVNDFAITLPELELLKKGGMTIFESMFNIKSNVKRLDKQNIGSKTINSQASFIKSLLYLMYSDTQLIESPRKIIDNPNSEIVKDFDSKGLVLPSGKTVATWLKNAELTRK